MIGEGHSAGGGGTSCSGQYFPREAVFVIAAFLREAIIKPTIRSSHESVGGVVVVKVLEISRRCIAFCDLMEYGLDEAVGGFEAVGVIGIGAVISVVHLEG